MPGLTPKAAKALESPKAGPVPVRRFGPSITAMLLRDAPVERVQLPFTYRDGKTWPTDHLRLKE